TAAARCVDETPVARVDANMIDLAAFHAEEQQIAGLQRAQRHRWRGASLLRGGARDRHPQQRMAVVDEPTAIEASRPRPAEAIRRTDEARRRLHDRLTIG